jgi:hypothetical protein
MKLSVFVQETQLLFIAMSIAVCYVSGSQTTYKSHMVPTPPKLSRAVPPPPYPHYTSLFFFAVCTPFFYRNLVCDSKVIAFISDKYSAFG